MICYVGLLTCKNYYPYQLRTVNFNNHTYNKERNQCEQKEVYIYAPCVLAWISNHMLNKDWGELFIHYETTTVQLTKFPNEQVIWSHTL